MIEDFFLLVIVCLDNFISLSSSRVTRIKKIDPWISVAIWLIPLTSILPLTFCRFPVVAMGLLKWVDCTVCDPSFFKLLTDSTPVHLALLDEVSRNIWPWTCLVQLPFLSLGNRDGTVVRALTSHQCVPGSISGLGIICGLSSLLVLFFALRGFSQDTRVFPSPQKTNISKFQFNPGMHGHFWTSSAKLFGVPWVNKLDMYLLFYIVLHSLPLPHPSPILSTLYLFFVSHRLVLAMLYNIVWCSMYWSVCLNRQHH